MSRTKWKQRERDAAALIGGTRYTANQGGPVDCESAGYCVQVKERRTLSLAALESLALEIERVGSQKTKAGLVMVKRSAGRGRRTPWLVVMTEGVFREMNGRLPTDVAAAGDVPASAASDSERTLERTQGEPQGEDAHGG